MYILDALQTPREMQQQIAKRAKEARLRRNISQKELASRSGVTLASLKRFEQTAEISLHALLALAFVLDEMNAFGELFSPPEESLLRQSKKQRQRSSRTTEAKKLPG